MFFDSDFTTKHWSNFTPFSSVSYGNLRVELNMYLWPNNYTYTLCTIAHIYTHAIHLEKEMKQDSRVSHTHTPQNEKNNINSRNLNNNKWKSEFIGTMPNEICTILYSAHIITNDIHFISANKADSRQINRSCAKTIFFFLIFWKMCFFCLWFLYREIELENICSCFVGSFILFKMAQNTIEFVSIVEVEPIILFVKGLKCAPFCVLHIFKMKEWCLASIQSNTYTNWTRKQNVNSDQNTQNDAMKLKIVRFANFTIFAK